MFEPTRDIYFNTLDKHADTLDGDVKPPLVLLGSEGSGKSALLANWVAKRREHKHRDEFLFQHFVGCSTQSLSLFDTLYRLETELKTFFGVDVALAILPHQLKSKISQISYWNSFQTFIPLLLSKSASEHLRTETISFIIQANLFFFSSFLS